MTSTTQRQEQQTPTPTSGTWVFDSAHSSLEAVARHLMVSKVRGRFERFGGSVRIGEDLADSRIDVTIDAASVNTNTPDRDNHLRSADFLDVDSHPELTFVSNKIERVGDDRFEVLGDLTIRGTTNEVTLAVRYLGLHTDPWGNDKAVFSATTSLDRERWGMSWNQALETGGVLVGKTLDVEIQVQLQRTED